MMVWAFDDTKTVARGEIILTVLIVPCDVVVDILAIFNLLLGRPWIHIARAKKLIYGNKLISVIAKKIELCAFLLWSRSLKLSNLITPLGTTF